MHQTTKNTAERARRWAGEFIVLFLAVTLSFLAEDLRENRSQHRDEILLLRSIRQDLSADLPTIRNIIETDSSAVVGAQWLHDNWERASLPADSVTWALIPQYSGRVYVPIKAAFESAKGSGRFDYIEDSDLRLAIGRHFESGQGEEKAVNDLVITSLLDLHRALRPYVSFEKTFPEFCCAPNVSLARGWSPVGADNALHSTLVNSEMFRRLSVERMRRFERTIKELDNRIHIELTRL